MTNVTVQSILRMENEMKKNITMSEHGNVSSGISEKRPYEKPAIAEEELYETCVVLACGMKPDMTTPGCLGNPTNAS